MSSRSSGSSVPTAVSSQALSTGSWAGVGASQSSNGSGFGRRPRRRLSANRCPIVTSQVLALARAGSLEPGAGDALATASRDAFVVGMQGAAALGAAVLALTAIGAWQLLGRAAASAEREPVGV